MADITGKREIERRRLPRPPFAGIADLWPAVAIAFGVLLTIAWAGGLSWLLLSLLLLVI